MSDTETTVLRIGTTIVGYRPIVMADGTPRHEAQTTAVRAIVDHILGPDTVVSHDAQGAPSVPGHNITITHSRLLAVVAVDPHRRIGVDAEEWRDALMRVRDRYMSAREAARYTTRADMLHVWTVKEAVYKVIGAAAYDFAHAISVTGDRAGCCGQTMGIHTFDVGATHITLVTKL